MVVSTHSFGRSVHLQLPGIVWLEIYISEQCAVHDDMVLQECSKVYFAMMAEQKLGCLCPKLPERLVCRREDRLRKM